MAARETIEDPYYWPIKAAQAKSYEYKKKYIRAPIGSKQEAAYLGLWRKWDKQLALFRQEKEIKLSTDYAG
jgi:hypothetical protein